MAALTLVLANTQQANAQSRKDKSAYAEAYERARNNAYQSIYQTTDSQTVQPSLNSAVYPQPVVEQKENKDEDIQKKQSEFSFNYRHPKDGGGGGYGISLMYKHVLLGYEMFWMKKSPSDYRAFDIYAGGNYRRFLGEWFYIEGRAMIGYKHVKMYGDKEGNVYLGLSPRIALDLIHTKRGMHVSLFGGYEADFLKFKFKKGYVSHSFPFGIAMIF